MSFYELPADRSNHFLVKIFDKPCTLAHFHKSIEIIFVLDGEIDAVINGVRYNAKRGECVFSDSFDVHYYCVKQDVPAKTLVLVVSQDYLGVFNDYMANKALNTLITVKPEILKFMEDWAYTFRDENKLVRSSKLMHVLASICQDNLVEKKTAPKNEFVSNIFKYIHDNYKKSISVLEIANKFGYSRGYVSTMFTTYTGEGFNSYVNRLRITSAKEEIDKKDGRRILDIALENGFDSANTFYRAYKKQYGESPLQKCDK
jgi:xylan 1,4-beta-xylosidase